MMNQQVFVAVGLGTGAGGGCAVPEPLGEGCPD